MVIAPEAQRTIDEQRDRIDALERENRILREELGILKQGLFGRRTERLDSSQLDFFRTGEGPAPAELVESGKCDGTATVRKRPDPGHGRARFPEHLPREVIELDLPEAERTCPSCGKAMRAIGEDVTERGHIVPVRIVVRRYVRRKYACPDGHAVRTAPAPEGVIDGAKYEASVYAHVVTAKYCDHLPLHRLEGMFRRYGVHLPKQTMWDMLVQVDENLAQPVLRQCHKELKEEAVLQADEMPATLRVEDGRGSRTGYAWGWRNLRGSGPSKVLVEFRTSRSRDGPLAVLGDWSGTLITDGYSGYDEVVARNGIVRAGCWAHARRKLKEALDAGSREAAWVLLPIQRLFAVERALQARAEREGVDHQQLLALREKVRARTSSRILTTIFTRADELSQQRSTLPKSKLGKALTYLERQRGPLSVFVSDARIPIHNNDEERDLRHLAIGRKNWLVFASERGGDVACRLYSLVLSCKQAGVNPQAYIEDVLGRLSTTKASDIASLTPWAWAAARS